MTISRAVDQGRRPHFPCRRALSGFGIVLSLSLSVSAAHASTYRVYTSSTSAMSLNANDGYCSLAEAVQQVNGTGVYNCQDFAPGSTQHRIELLQTAGKPYSSHHYNITTL